MTSTTDLTLTDSVSTTWLRWGFRRYTVRYLQKHFTAVRLAKGTSPQLTPDERLVCLSNHASWWDPLVAIFLTESCLASRPFRAPMDASALQAYPLFERLGFFPVERNTAAGARSFLATSRAIFECGGSALWVTPGGRFQDVRESIEFEPGIGHLASRVKGLTFIPVAIEYLFWDERCPEVLIEFGEPIRDEACLDTDHRVHSDVEAKQRWTERLEAALAGTQTSLRAKAIARDPQAFQTLLNGTVGVGGVYDSWRRLVAMVTGRSFQKEHRTLTGREARGG